MKSAAKPYDPLSQPEHLRGVVERVTFHSEETGYGVLKVRPENCPHDLVTVTGKTPHVVPGEMLDAEGVWEQTRDYGAQFKAERLTLKRPETLDGLERYLGSGLIDGIGPAYAKRIVAKFGAQALDIIEHESSKLEQVDGIGSKRRHEIRASWMKQKAVHAIMLFLHQHGISSSRALRIYKNYGDQAESVLKADPFRLASDIRGIGFKTADVIAAQLGMATDAPQRLRAGVLHTLDRAAESGHCCLPFDRVLEEAVELLGTQAQLLEMAISSLIHDGSLQSHQTHGQHVLYLPHLRHAEESVASHLRSMASGPWDHAWTDTTLDAAIARAERTHQITLAEGQRRAARDALCHRVVIITGGPGVGKTTLLRTILAVHQSEQKKLVLAAPTGRAARRLQESSGLEARTLHRLLEAQENGVWGRHRGKPLNGDVFVIDEVSMIDLPLMAQLLAALPAAAQLLLVGDADQLPSVGPGMVLQDVIASGVVPCARLTEIFRQAASSRIVTSAHSINRGEIPDLKPQRDSDFFFLEHPEPEDLRQTLIGLVKTRLPDRYEFDPVSDIQVLTPMNRNTLGTRALNDSLQAALNPPNEFKFEIDRFGTTFRVGDKVLQTLNDYDKDIFNGDLGVITAIETEPTLVRVRFDSTRSVEYEPGELDALQLAYAMTIHKSQGCEFPCVVIPVSTQHYVLLERSLIYTAVTRARKLVVLVGDPKALQLAVQKQQSRRRWTGLLGLLTDPI